MRLAVIKAVVVAVALWTATSHARAEVRILASPGGQVGPFLDMFDRVRESGERVVIDGPCLSACTLVLSTVPNERICVTRRAVLGFHAARSIDRRGRMYAEPEASQAVLEAYPAPVRGWISRRGGLSSRLLLLRGRELAAIYPTSDEARRWARRIFACTIHAVGTLRLITRSHVFSGQLTIQGCRTCRRTCRSPWRRRSCRTAC